MSSKWKTGLIKYGSCIAFICLLGGGYLWMEDIASATRVDQYRILCDAFFVPGVLLACLGAMVWVSNEGILWGIGYALRQAVFSLIPGKRIQRDEKYADYVERKREKKVTGYGFLFFSGAGSVLVSLVFYALFYIAYG